MQVGEVYAKFRLDLKDFKAGIETAKRGFRDLGAYATTRINALRSTLFSLQGVLAGLGLGMTAKAFIQAASSMEVWRMQLATSLGSLERAKDLLEWISKFAATTPFEISDLVKTSTLLEAVGMDAKKTMETIGNTAASFGRNIYEVANALVSMEAEPLRRLGIQVQREGNEAVFQWTNTLGELKERTARGGYDIQREILLSIWNERYSGGMERFQQTWEAKFSNVKDAAFRFASAMGDAMLPTLKKLADERLIPLLERMEKWARINEHIIAQKVENTIEKIAKGIQRIYAIYEKIPTEVLTYGLVGGILFGPKGAGIGALLGFLSAELEKFNKNLEVTGKKWWEAFLHGMDPNAYRQLEKDLSFFLPAQPEKTEEEKKEFDRRKNAVQVLTKEQKALFEKLNTELRELREGETGKIEAEYEKRLKIANGNAQLMAKVEEWRATQIHELNKKITDDYLVTWAGAYDEFEEMMAKPPGILEREGKEIIARIEAPMRQAVSIYHEIFADAYDEFDRMMAAPPGKMLETVRFSAKEISEIERQLMEDIGEFTKNEYEIKKKYLDKALKDYIDGGIKKEIAEEWYSTQLIKIEEERILRTEEFLAGLKVAYDRSRRELYTWAQAGSDIFNGMVKSMEGSLGDFFYDTFSGNLKSAEDYFKSFKNAILREWSNMISRMITQWLAMQAIKGMGALFGTGGGTDMGSNWTYTGAESSYGIMHRGYVPRLHSGLRADEFPAILQSGEAIIRKSSVTARTAPVLDTINKTGDVPGGEVHNHFYIHAVDAPSFVSLLARNKNAISGLVAGNIQANGPVRKALR